MFPVQGAVSIVGQPVQVNVVNSPLTVQGTVSTTPTGVQQVDILRFGSTGVTLGQKTAAASIPVVLPSDQTISVVAEIAGDTADLNSSGGTDYHEVFAIGLPGANGHVVGGTALNPIRTDPTGTTVQPVNGTVNIGNIVTVQGTVSLAGQPITVQGGVQVTNSNGSPVPVAIVAGSLPSDLNLIQVGGIAITLGQKAPAASLPVVLATGTSVAVTASSPLPVAGNVSITNPSLAVTASNLDIRSLASNRDSVTVTGNVSITGNATVVADNLNIRTLTAARDSITVSQGSSWSVQANQSGAWNVGILGAVAVTQQGAWNTGRTWVLDSNSDSVTVTGVVASAQLGSWTVGRNWNLASANDSVTVTGNVGIAGTPSVHAASPFPVTQSGAWSVGRSWSLSSNTDSVFVTGSVAAAQLGTWNVGRTWNLSSGGDTVGVTGTVAATQSGAWNVGFTNPVDVSDREARLLGRAKLLNAAGALINPAQEHIQANDAHASRLTDGTGFYDARQIRNLSSANDSVTVTGSVTLASGSNFNGTVDLVKVGGTNVTLGQKAASASIPVVLAAGTAIDVAVTNFPASQVVTATNLDIRSLVANRDSVTVSGTVALEPGGSVIAHQGGTWATGRIWTLASNFDSVTIGNSNLNPVPVAIISGGGETEIASVANGSVSVTPLATEVLVSYIPVANERVFSVWASGDTDATFVLTINGVVALTGYINRSSTNVEKNFKGLQVTAGQTVELSVTCTGPVTGNYHGTIEHG